MGKNLQLQAAADNAIAIDQHLNNVLQFLKDAGLPYDNIIAATKERQIINKNLPEYIMGLPADVKRDARYLAKFVIGAGFGLFDYSLNSIWNEVVLSLRQKAINYGLDIFYDNAVGGSMRDNFRTEEDLADLKDIVLLNTCHKLELITAITHKKLVYILDMRNDIGISHPTNNVIGAFELMSWLNTAIQEVLADQPSPAAIKVKQFIDNLKTYGVELDKKKVDEITPELQSLSTHHCGSILRTLFGLYVARDTNPILVKNISILAPIIWPLTQDGIKNHLGITLAGYNNNLSLEKHTKGSEFFTLVKGNAHLPVNDRVVPLDRLIKQLENTHAAYDNYAHEAPIAEEIMTYIEKDADIPDQIAGRLVYAFALCRIGRGYNYKGGVSPKGKIYYDMFFKLLASAHVPHLIYALTGPIIHARLGWSAVCRNACVEMLILLRQGIVNERHLEAIDFLIQNLPSNGNAVTDSRFKTITDTFMRKY